MSWYPLLDKLIDMARKRRHSKKVLEWHKANREAVGFLSSTSGSKYKGMGNEFDSGTKH